MGDLRDQLERHLTRPVSRYIDILRNRVRDLNANLDVAAGLDQFPGRAPPYMFSRLFGPVALTTPRRYDNSNNGFEKLATVANPGAYVLPRDGSIKVGRIGTFVWEATAMTTYVTATWTTDMNSALGVHTKAFATQGDLFSSVIDDNGGALLVPNGRYVDPGFDTSNNQDVINVSCELGLYDKLRGRYLHDGDRLPTQVFSGQGIENRNVGEPIPFDPNADIEPRLYVNEVRMRDVMNTDTIFNEALLQAWVSFVMIGHLEQTDRNMGGY